MKYTQADLNKLGTIMGIWAHPDDEAFSMAGLMSYARRNGQRVIIVTATRGDAGESADENRWPKSRLGFIREQELRDSLAISGVSDVYILNYLDGTLNDQDSEQAVKLLCDLIQAEKPDTIISFYEDGITGHDDHKTIHDWARQAWQQLDRQALFLCVVECHESYEEHGRHTHEQFNVYFNVEQPKTYKKNAVDVCIDLDDMARADKEKALRAHASQTAHMFADEKSCERLLGSVGSCECFIALKK